MFRIEPPSQDLLEKRPEQAVFKVPPYDYSFIELHELKYFKSNKHYITKYYNFPCHVVASGTYLYQNLFKSTIAKKFFLLKFVDKELYYLMTEGEKDKYLLKEEKVSIPSELVV